MGEPATPMIECLLVIPPGLRPIVPLGAGRYMISDITDHYRTVLHFNARAARDGTARTRPRLEIAVMDLLQNELDPDGVEHDGKRISSLRSMLLPGSRWGPMWDVILDLDERAGRDPRALDGPLPEPHFSLVWHLRGACIDLRPRDSKGVL